jgi:hypothetical protein
MPESGVIFKRCGCRNGHGKRLEKACPQLQERGHGTWYFDCSASNVLGRPERERRGGFPSRAAARRACDAWLAATTAQRTAGGGPSGGGWGIGCSSTPRSGRPLGCTTPGTSTGCSSPTWAATGWLISTRGCCAASSTRSPRPPTPKADRSQRLPCSTCAPRCAPRSTSPSKKG